MDSDINHMNHPTCDTEFKKLRAAVRLHKENKNDAMLYSALPEGPLYVEEIVKIEEPDTKEVILGFLNDKWQDKE